VFDTACPPEIERRATESITKMNSMDTIRTYPCPVPATADTPSRSLGPSESSLTPPRADDDLQTACSRAVATFLTPNATKELPVDAVVRDTVIRTLAYNCHPDVVSSMIHTFS
jgi:hypothetical protein